ncbi:MAG: adenylyltransferase/cytidyltransferase family protein [Candidatus Stahlbacteria bacterium]|nr:adenylyltransferase/cytidyltransferase family protein [Candidatus Stahlbacteria bacterium]
MKFLGELYKEKILPRDDLEEVYLPHQRDNIRIDHRLFEWRLYHTPKKYIVCKSELEARYFKVWMEAEVTTISIPRDEEFLKIIVPELEELKRKLDEAIKEEMAEYVLSRKNRERALHYAWGEFTKYKDYEEEEEVKKKKIECLHKAKELGDILIVGLNTDNSVKKLKGSSRPIFNESDRAKVLSAIRWVDYVVLFADPTPQKLIQILKPNILVKGGDYEPGAVVGKEIAENVVIIPLLPGYSTTEIIKKVQMSKLKVQTKSKCQKLK